MERDEQGNEQPNNRTFEQPNYGVGMTNSRMTKNRTAELRSGKIQWPGHRVEVGPPFV